MQVWNKPIQMGPCQLNLDSEVIITEHTAEQTAV